ncbi:phosphodiester glycosidase family protein [Deinococcus sp. 6YEL10]|uniref:phosphodiester glycosidase family protein n=1 Tax=Deinococcus sp. 6YEL10 TaxID=2745870 RepID=UPI001E429A77|nr:phosphodiester glycosidase family protein [Deinococcus sp. 6YEL10]MCD0161137.1 phosphodiester glycosidase family protein [Deinococcus sp. 6YEL10]
MLLRSRVPAALVALSFTLHSASSALTVEPVVAGGTLYTVATVNLATDRLQLHWLNPTTQAPYTTFSQLRARLRKEGRSLSFATNSGIYAPGLKPLGLHVENGRTLVPLNMASRGGNFALLPNGVFWVKGTRAGVTETRRYAAMNVQPAFATQSGPLLLQDGKVHPAFNRSGTSFKLRSGVGVCRDGRVRFAVSAGPVNFYSFAVFFRDTLGCLDALYLDGSISAYATADRSTQLAEFAGIWSVSR